MSKTVRITSKMAEYMLDVLFESTRADPANQRVKCLFKLYECLDESKKDKFKLALVQKPLVIG